MLDICKQIVAAAYDTEIGLFSRPDGASMSCEDVLALLEERYLDSRTVDFFRFSSGPMRTRSKIAYAENGEIVESIVADIKELILRDRNDEELRYLPHAPREPLSFYAFPLEYGPGERHYDASQLRYASLKVSTTSDIWLPWIPTYDDMGAMTGYADNRALASRHSTRLNRFFDESSRICGAGSNIGCTNMAEKKWIDPMIGPEGVKMIDAPPPVFK